MWQLNFGQKRNCHGFGKKRLHDFRGDDGEMINANCSNTKLPLGFFTARNLKGITDSGERRDEKALCERGQGR